MALRYHQQQVAALLFAVVVLSGVKLSTCQVVKDKVSCLDCHSHYDLSGVKVQVKCDKVQKLATTSTKSDGSFEVELPAANGARSPNPMSCLASLRGGPTKLYASRKNMVSKIVKVKDARNSYTTSTALAFFTSCPSWSAKCGNPDDIDSSKTVNLPLPKEWGFAPSSYYVPFFPIIGIP
uniref:Pollen Ole e 1 allergen and extensin family protein n=1 Tax=Rhizophora mucronata TaxID=61149 RepID=A0A2P2MXV0_RHIMU